MSMAEQTTRVPLIAGNWKMNLDHLEAVTLVQRLTWLLTDADHDQEAVEVAVFPPFTGLRAVQTLVTGDRLDLAYGAQDLSPEDAGAYTGDVSGAFLAAAALRHGLTPVICVGEGLEVRQAGRHVEHTLAQLEGSIAGLSAQDVAGVVVAYEPVWAIGTGEVAGPEDAQQMCAALRARVAALHGDDVAAGLRILYGGSVKSSSAPALLAQPDVDGALVGGASLDADEFAKIVRFDQA